MNKATTGNKESGIPVTVRPALEYAHTVWGSHLKKDIVEVEKVQRKLASFVTLNYNRDDSVTAMLKDLKWLTLQERRFASRMSIMYQAINGQATVNILAFVAK